MFPGVVPDVAWGMPAMPIAAVTVVAMVVVVLCVCVCGGRGEGGEEEERALEGPSLGTGFSENFYLMF